MQSSIVFTQHRPSVTEPGYRLGMRPANYGRKFPAEPLSKDEVHRLLKACGRGYAGTRNKALWVILWRCGLRISEALALYPKDLDLEAGTVTVLHGKGDERRVVGIDPEAAAVITVWLERRRGLGVGSRSPVFCVISRPNIGRGMHSSAAREALKELAERAGIERRVHPHGLRHTHAVELYREGVPLLIIQKQLGHSALATTARYVDHLMPGEVIDAMQARTWEQPVKHPGPDSLAA